MHTAPTNCQDEVLAPKLRVLIIEDDADCADSTALLLRTWGFTAEIARDGEAGLAAAQGQRPDVLLLDIGLPKLNGYDVAKHLNDLIWKKKPFIIAMTGRDREKDQQRADEAGIHLRLTKPVNPQELLALLQRFERIIN